MRELLAIPVAVTLGACVHGSPPADAVPADLLEMKNTGTPGQAEATRIQKATAVVTAVDLANRTVTLKNKAGEAHTISVGPQVQRLNEVVVGDTILVEYEEGLMLELQSAGSESVPPTVVAVGEREGADQPAGGVAAAGVQATVTVTAIDMGNRMVVFQGPGGNYYQVKAGSNIKLEKLTVGDRLLATYVQAVAITLEKPAKK